MKTSLWRCGLLVLMLSVPWRADADSQPPSLLGLSVAPDPVLAGASISVSVSANDAGSGVQTSKMVVVLLDPAGGGQISLTNNWTTVGPGTYSTTTTLPPHALAGWWRVYFVLLYDQAGNGKIFLEGRDYTKKFLVQNALPDGAPPVLTGLSVSPDPVAVPGPVTVTIGLEDQPSGVNTNALVVVLLDPDRGDQHNISNWVMTAANTYQGQATLGTYAEQGPWEVFSILAYDRASNGVYYLNGRDYTKTFQVVNPQSDGAPPVVERVTVEPASVLLGAPVTVTLDIRDAPSGVDLSQVQVHLLPENGGAGFHHAVTTWTVSDPDTLVGTVVIGPGAPAGRWYVQSVFAHDLADNEGHYLPGTDFPPESFSVVIPNAPIFFQQPLSVLARVGGTATFSVGAAGVAPLAYQWFLNGAPIAGAVSPSYTTPPLAVTSDGDAFACVVSNLFGAVTSSLATVRFGLSDYQQVVTGQTPDYWFRLDSELTNSGTMTAPPLVRAGGHFVPDRAQYDGLAFLFDRGEQSLVQEHDIVGDVGSMTMLFRTPDVAIEGTRHVITQGKDNLLSNAFNLAFANPDLKLKVGNATATLVSGQPGTAVWYYVGFTWDMSRDTGEVRWWVGPLGGSIASGTLDVNNTAVAGAGGPLVLGSDDLFSFGNFRERSHGGIIDEPALWTRELSETEIIQQFAASVAPIGFPFVIQQPSSVTVPEGGYAQVGIAAIGDAPLLYQWLRDGLPLAGQTGATVSVGPLNVGSDNGTSLRCVVSNALGATTSQAAVVSVVVPRDFQQTVAAQQPDYWFPLDNSLGNVGTQYAPPLVRLGGAYTNDNVGNSNSAFAVTGGNHFLREDLDILAPTGTMTLLFRTPEVPLTGFRHVFGQGADSATSNAWNLVFNNPNLTLKAGNANVTLINGQPVPGAWYFFSATWDEDRNSGEVKWFFGPVGGALSSGTLSIADDAPVGAGGPIFLGNKDPGFGSFRETNSAGVVDEAIVWSRELTSTEVLDQFITTAAPLGYPYIVNPPQNRSGKDGESVTYSAGAIGQAPLTYQWRSNGVPVTGATGTNFVFGPLNLGQTGIVFDVVVSNALGVVTSAPAALTVSPLSDYQALLQGQAPDYWFRLDNSLINRGTQPAPDLASGGGVFSQDVARVEASAYHITAASGFLRQPNDIVSPTGSISFLFRMPDVPMTGFRHLLAQGVDTVTSNAFNITYNNANLVLRIGASQATLISGAPAAGAWYYFAATWDDARAAGEVTWHIGRIGTALVAGTLNIVDGTLVGNGGPLFVGNRDDVTAAAWRMSASAPGAVDEVALWNRELTPSEISAQFDGAFPVVSQLAGSNLVFRSSGTNAPAGAWQLRENGFVGCFVVALAPATVTVSAAMSGIADSGIFPAAAIRIGNDGSAFNVNSAGVYSNTFVLPAGTHALRVELTNAPYGSSRWLTVDSVGLSGAGATLWNVADDATCLAAAQSYIEWRRKGDVTITVVDSMGVTQQNAQVDIVLRRHSFRFGAATTGLRADRDALPYSQLNWLTGASTDAVNYRNFVSNYFHAVGFKNAAKWNPQEYDRDVPDMIFTDQLLAFAETNRMAARIHTVGWANDTFAPDWAYTLYTNALAGSATDAAEFRTELSERINYLVRTRAHRYDEVDVVNEDYHKTGYTELYGTNGLAAIYLEAKTNALFAGGRAKTYANEFNVLRFEIENNDYLQSYANWYRRHIEGIDSAAGSPVVDGIGVQGHVRTDASARSLTPYSIRRNLQTLLHLGVLGKPISITEFDVTDDDGAGGPLTDAEATNILMTAMTTFFGSPAVTTFMMWDFWEPSTDTDKVGVSLVDSNWNLTASGIAFTNRMGEWRSRASFVADATGKGSFRGFFGEYSATVTAPGGSPTTLVFRLAPGTTSTSIVLVANGGAASTNSYATVVQGQAPDYWFRFSSNLTNSGSQPAPNFIADGGSFANDYDGVTNRAYQMTAAGNDLSQTQDIISPTGSFSMIFRTPNVPIAFRHLLAQGGDPLLGNAFNIIHANPNIQLRIGNASATLLAGFAPTATWYYVAATWDETRDAGEVRWWFGPAGGLLTSGTLNIGDTNTVGDGGILYLGNRGAGFNVAWRETGAPGSFDEFAAWTREINGAEVTNQFAALTQGIAPPPALPGGALPPPPVVGSGTIPPGYPAQGFMVIFGSVIGEKYDVYWTDTLLGGTWLYAVTLTATGTVTAWEDTGDIGIGRPAPTTDPLPRFYQIRSR